MSELTLEVLVVGRRICMTQRGYRQYLGNDARPVSRSITITISANLPRR